MLLLIAIVVLVAVGLLAWKALSLQRDEVPAAGSPVRRPVAPDDDPDFLRRLDERARRDREDPPTFPT